MALNPVPTELTTGATDALLALLSLGGARWLRDRLAGEAARAATWALPFHLLAAASALGAVVHGLDLTERVRAALWHPLYLLLGLAVAAFAVAAVHDRFGAGAARRARWPLLAVAVGFYALTQALGGLFVVFVAFEGIAMLAALASYAALAARRRLRGAGVIAAGILLDLVAAGVQASPLRARIVVPLDHNGLFHLVQAAALLALFAGIGARRAVTPSGSS